MSADPASAFLAETRPVIDRALERLLPHATEPPRRLHEAMRYSVLAGGKRLRPALVIAAARLGGLAAEAIAGPAAAVELIHTYSLVHDDLPAMDDDDLRRGKPTCHVVFGEAMAILAGDALLTLALEVLAREPEGEDLAPRRAEAVARVARAAGHRGMVGGQVLDLEATAAGDAMPEVLEQVHNGKTGALMGASLALGALHAGLKPAEVDRLDRFGTLLGLTFQVVDDILDVEGDAAVLGKTAGKDASNGKLTYPGRLGLDGARKAAVRHAALAEAELAGFGPEADLLRSLVGFVLQRRS